MQHTPSGVAGDGARDGSSPSRGVADQLRTLADWLDAHPGVPVSQIDTFREKTQIFCFSVHDPEGLAALVKAAGGKWDKIDADGLFKLRQEIMPGFVFDICALRDSVCERVVVGTREVEVPDPDAPTVTVEEEIVEWRCGSLLDPKPVSCPVPDSEEPTDVPF